jgi:hypothetical protein
MGFVNPVCESNVGSKATFPWGQLCYRTAPPNTPVRQPVLTTARPHPGPATSTSTGRSRRLRGVHARAGRDRAEQHDALGDGNGGRELDHGHVGYGVRGRSGHPDRHGHSFGVRGHQLGRRVGLNLVESAGFGLSITHASGATVTNGAAVVVGQNSKRHVPRLPETGVARRGGWRHAEHADRAAPVPIRDVYATGLLDEHDAHVDRLHERDRLMTPIYILLAILISNTPWAIVFYYAAKELMDQNRDLQRALIAASDKEAIQILQSEDDPEPLKVVEIDDDHMVKLQDGE